MKQQSIKDISRKPAGQLAQITADELMKLPPPYDKWEDPLPVKPMTDDQKAQYECSLDGISALELPKPKTKEEEDKLVESFLNGVRKLFSPDDNWTLYQQLVLSLEACTRCQSCNEACPIYVSSGKQEIYRPTYRPEVLRRIVNRYIKNGGKILPGLRGNDIELTWPVVARLAESAYRCTICRRCSAWCPMGSDNGLITRELRKLFSQEMGIAPKAVHEAGSMKQLETGASTGLGAKAFKGIIKFMENEIEEKTGKSIQIPLDKKGADILLVHNSGEYLTWMENPEAFAIIFEAAGISWTLSTDLMGYEATNYGTWYDDVQFARIALRQLEAAKKLGVKKIVVGECGHAHKAFTVISDRVTVSEMGFPPRESYIPLLEDLVVNNKLDLDPKKNNFPVTLHDPCNIVRLMGIAEPQRNILKKICPQFREMTPHGVENYCCGGGSGFGIIDTNNFPDWRTTVAGRMKFKQVLEAFQDVISPDIKKYVCAPCSNCKGQFRNLFSYYDATKKCGLYYGGLVELVVNAMKDIKEPYIKFE